MSRALVQPFAGTSAVAAISRDKPRLLVSTMFNDALDFRCNELQPHGTNVNFAQVQPLTTLIIRCPICSLQVMAADAVAGHVQPWLCVRTFERGVEAETQVRLPFFFRCLLSKTTETSRCSLSYTGMRHRSCCLRPRRCLCKRPCATGH